MLKTDYPARPSYFLGKDAILRTYGFWTNLKNFFTRPCYPYPVVYTDGLISYVVSDKDSRTPWGIAIGDYVFALLAPEEEMTVKEAKAYCQTIEFAQRKAFVPSIDILHYIRKNIRPFNDMLKALDGTPFEKKIYLSETTSTTKKQKMLLAMDFKHRNDILAVSNTDEDKVFLRPAINIADLY